MIEITAKDFAAMINGRKYLEEITEAETQIAKNNDLVIAFRHGDDLLELRGAIYDEIIAGKEEAAFILNGKSYDEYDFSETKSFVEGAGITMPPFIKLSSAQHPENFLNVMWQVTAEGVDSYRFDVMSGVGVVYCRGCVFSLPDPQHKAE